MTREGIIRQGERQDTASPLEMGTGEVDDHLGTALRRGVTPPRNAHGNATGRIIKGVFYGKAVLHIIGCERVGDDETANFSLYNSITSRSFQRTDFMNTGETSLGERPLQNVDFFTNGIVVRFKDDFTLASACSGVSVHRKHQCGRSAGLRQRRGHPVIYLIGGNPPADVGLNLDRIVHGKARCFNLLQIGTQEWPGDFRPLCTGHSGEEPHQHHGQYRIPIHSIQLLK